VKIPHNLVQTNDTEEQTVHTTGVTVSRNRDIEIDIYLLTCLLIYLP